jgi:hypothetical protein
MAALLGCAMSEETKEFFRRLIEQREAHGDRWEWNALLSGALTANGNPLPPQQMLRLSPFNPLDGANPAFLWRGRYTQRGQQSEHQAAPQAKQQVDRFCFEQFMKSREIDRELVEQAMDHRPRAAAPDELVFYIEDVDWSLVFPVTYFAHNFLPDHLPYLLAGDAHRIELRAMYPADEAAAVHRGVSERNERQQLKPPRLLQILIKKEPLPHRDSYDVRYWAARHGGQTMRNIRHHIKTLEGQIELRNRRDGTDYFLFFDGEQYLTSHRPTAERIDRYLRAVNIRSTRGKAKK